MSWLPFQSSAQRSIRKHSVTWTDNRGCSAPQTATLWHHFSAWVKFHQALFCSALLQDYNVQHVLFNATQTLGPLSAKKIKITETPGLSLVSQICQFKVEKIFLHSFLYQTCHNPPVNNKEYGNRRLWTSFFKNTKTYCQTLIVFVRPCLVTVLL